MPDTQRLQAALDEALREEDADPALPLLVEGGEQVSRIVETGLEAGAPQWIWTPSGVKGMTLRSSFSGFGIGSAPTARENGGANYEDAEPHGQITCEREDIHTPDVHRPGDRTQSTGRPDQRETIIHMHVVGEVSAPGQRQGKDRHAGPDRCERDEPQRFLHPVVRASISYLAGTFPSYGWVYTGRKEHPVPHHPDCDRLTRIPRQQIPGSFGTAPRENE